MITFLTFVLMLVLIGPDFMFAISPALAILFFATVIIDVVLLAMFSIRIWRIVSYYYYTVVFPSYNKSQIPEMPHLSNELCAEEGVKTKIDEQNKDIEIITDGFEPVVLHGQDGYYTYVAEGKRYFFIDPKQCLEAYFSYSKTGSVNAPGVRYVKKEK